MKSFNKMTEKENHINEIKEAIKWAVELNRFNSAYFLSGAWIMCENYYEQYDYKDEVLKRIEGLKVQLVDSK